MSKFDLKRALKGEPVVLRNGTKAYVRHRETRLKTDYPMIGYVEEGGTVDIMLWTEDGHEHVYKVKSEYDIVDMWSEPLVFEHWGLLREDIKYLAKDADERWFGYSEKPSMDEEDWHVQFGDVYYSVSSLKPTFFPDCDWENSLMERPEND